jgi:Polyketide cyclase / dehydrase and lipid transport
MRPQRIDVRATSTATPGTVYRLLRDGSTWPDWTPIESFELEREGEDEREGIGAIRIFRRGRVTGRDEVTGYVRDRRFCYRHVSGLPVRDYHADIDLGPTADGGTGIRWRASFRPTIPGTGWLYRLGIGRMLRQSAQGLAAHAVQREHGATNGTFVQ